MSRYRIELRIFGLLLFALLSTLILAFGLEASDVQGDILGVKFSVVGPSAAFIVIILIFFATGLFKFGLDKESSSLPNHPVEKLTIEEIEEMLDELLVKSRKIQRYKERLEAAKKAIMDQSTPDEVMAAIGMKPVRRPRA